MRRLQVRVLSGVHGRVVELVDTRHLNCLSPKGECGFDSRPDYESKIKAMEQLQDYFLRNILPIIFKVIEYSLLVGMIYAGVMLIVNTFKEIF